MSCVRSLRASRSNSSLLIFCLNQSFKLAQYLGKSGEGADTKRKALLLNPLLSPTSAKGPGARPALRLPHRHGTNARPFEGREKTNGPRSTQARPAPPSQARPGPVQAQRDTPTAARPRSPAPPHSLLHVLAQRLAQALLGRLQLAHVRRHPHREEQRVLPPLSPTPQSAAAAVKRGGRPSHDSPPGPAARAGGRTRRGPAHAQRRRQPR